MPTALTPENLAISRQLKMVLDAVTQLKYVVAAADDHIAAGTTTNTQVKTLANTTATNLVNQATTIATSFNMSVRLNTLTGSYIVLDNP